MMGIIELYEYLKGSPMIGPFGTIENPVLIPSVTTERVVGCTGGTGDDEHMILFFRCQEGRSLMQDCIQRWPQRWPCSKPDMAQNENLPRADHCRGRNTSLRLTIF